VATHCPRTTRARRAPRPRAESIHERRLADAGLARDEGDAALAGGRAIQPLAQPSERGLASDEAVRRVRRAPGDGRDEAIPAAARALDEARRTRGIPESAANLEDGVTREGVADVDAVPDRRQQLRPGDEPAGPLDQIAQHGEGLWTERDALGATK
jgi:hypothetical protein